MKTKYFLSSLLLTLCSAVQGIAQDSVRCTTVKHITTAKYINTEINITGRSTLGFDDLLYDNDGKGLTTFLNDKKISKEEMLDKVGDAMKSNVDARITFANKTWLKNNNCNFASISLRTQANLYLPKSLFAAMKTIENARYEIQDVQMQANAYLELGYGQERFLNNKWSIRGKGKLLLGIANFDMKAERIMADLRSEEKWIIEAKGEKNASMSSGAGLAIDLATSYRINKEWTISAVVNDLGFICWFNNKHYESSKDPFTFEGFKDVSVDKKDFNSAKKQLERLRDDIEDLAGLNHSKTNLHTNLIGATLVAEVDYNPENAKWLGLNGSLSQRVYGNYSWTEARAKAYISPWTNFPMTFYCTTAVGTFDKPLQNLGLGAQYSFSKATLYIVSNNIPSKFTPQFLPVSCNGNILMGIRWGV